jgi:2-keto-4-pentenoate hydratase/2-oxohepta-3-ene-1,7-dioic acid hydratase in catechol pathway
MKLASLRYQGEEKAGILVPGGIIPLELLNRKFDWKYPNDLLSLIETGPLETIGAWYQAGGEHELPDIRDLLIPEKEISFAPLYRRPRKIWGIGLNYQAHAKDLSEKAPETEPAGFTTILDMTAEDILRRNPRYLTRAKSFDTFFSFGPVLVTPEEIPDVLDLRVSTVLNGQILAEDRVVNMTFPPDVLVAFHSEVMTLLPGDIISTGTPGAAMIQDGDRVECRIDGFETLMNPVRDLKNI